MAIAGSTQGLVPVQNSDCPPVNSAAGILIVGDSLVAPAASGVYRERPLESPTQISLVGPIAGFWFTQTAVGELSPEKDPIGWSVGGPVGKAKMRIWLWPESAT